MTKKAALVAAALLVLTAICGGAIQVQIMVGVWLLLPTVEITMLTPSGAIAGFRQEVGLRSWLSFPDARSDFLRRRFRCGIEYSPMLWDREEGWLPAFFWLGLNTSFRLDDPSTATSTDLFLSARYGTFFIPPLLPAAGIAVRSQDF